MIRSRDQEILARKKSERRYRDLFNAAPDAVSILDDNGKVTDVNPAACELYGLSKEEMLGKPSIDFIDKQNWQVCQVNFEQLRDEHTDVEEEITILYGADKEWRPVWRKARALLDENGRFGGVLAYDRDISNQKELEKLREDLERIARHDLKTPLNGIINIPYLIKRENNLSANQLRWLQMIEDSGYKMLDLINRSLDMYRMEAGTYPFQPVGVDMVAVLQKIALDLINPMQTKRLEFHINLHGKPVTADSSFLVPGDELLCYSMLANLIKNAVEASPTGKVIEASLETQEQHSIAIHNLGAVPTDLRECFFSKYTTAGKKCGTGLGTYSAMLMAKTQNGEITMRSSTAEGTVVTVSFPKTV
jgi:PAS domain S-box-containing protein